MDALLAEIARCRICRDAPRGKPLPHEPRPVLQASPSARILIVGQAPGTRVHASGKPFTDPSGDRLRQWLGIGPEIFYDAGLVAIVPMGFCFPGLDAKGGDLPPRRECAPAWREKVMGGLKQVEVVIAIGTYAQAWHLGVKEPVTETVRQWKSYARRSPPVFPLPHPSWRNSGWLKAHPWFEAELVPALQEELRKRLAPAKRRP
jgi:uracil-DNA glycosylase